MKRKSNVVIFLLVVFLGMAVRLLIAWYGLSPLDTDSVYHVFNEIQKGKGIYNDQWLYYNNPPVWGWLINILGILSVKTEIWLSFWSKLPFILSDLGIYLVLFYYTASLPFLKRIFFASLYFLNPLTIIVSAYQGQLESLFLLPLLVSALLLNVKLNKNRIFASGLLWGISSTIKIIPFFVLPAYFIYFWRHAFLKILKQKIIALSLFAFASVLPLFLVFLPFINNLEYVFPRILTYQPPFWGFWGIGGMKKLIEVFTPLVMTDLGSNQLIVLFFSLFLAIFILLLKKFSIVTGILISFLSVYLLAGFFSPHYLLWIVPFLVVVLAAKSFPRMSIFFVYSLFAFLLEFSWLMAVLSEKDMTLSRWRIISLTHDIVIPQFAVFWGGLISLPLFLVINVVSWFLCLLILIFLLKSDKYSH